MSLPPSLRKIEPTAWVALGLALALSAYVLIGWYYNGEGGGLFNNYVMVFCSQVFLAGSSLAAGITAISRIRGSGEALGGMTAAILAIIISAAWLLRFVIFFWH